MNTCWPYGGSSQQLNLSSLERPLYDTQALAMLASQYQPSLMNALFNFTAPSQRNTIDDNNHHTSQRLTTNNNSNHHNSNHNNNGNNHNNDSTDDSTHTSNENEQTNQENNNSNNANGNPAKKLWRPLDIMH